MEHLIALFGNTPRVRILEAMFRFADVEFTAADMAEEAGLHKPSAYRIVRTLEKEGLLERTTRRRPVKYKVAESSPKVMSLGYLEATLHLIESAERRRAPPAEAVALLRGALARTGKAGAE